MIVMIANFMNVLKDFPSRAVDRSMPANVEDMGLIPGPGSSHGEGNGNPLQYSCLEKNNNNNNNP